MKRSIELIGIIDTGIFMMLMAVAVACQLPKAGSDSIVISSAIQPVFVTDSVLSDSDDPAIWINRSNPGQSLIIGTDKGGDGNDGSLYVFDLHGREIVAKRISNLKRPNNVDAGYDFLLGAKLTDIVVCTERNRGTIRVFSLPDMLPIDNGGIDVFSTDSLRAVMGVALYRSAQGKMYAIVSRKRGQTGSYLWEYEISDDGTGNVTGNVVRKFGAFSGHHEIESIAVDSELGYVYYSDEGVGIRKYYAHPDSSNVELALFATSGFALDHEGISIYKAKDSTGYILVSDQGADQFRIFPREGAIRNKHDHPLIGIVKGSTIKSDGSDVTSESLPGFPQGLFVAMSDDRTFQIYRWEDLLKQIEN